MERPASRESQTEATRSSGLSIFVCYRREDSAGFARALKTVLGERYGKDRIFMDLDNIAPGELWEDAVQDAVSGCDVLIALIGKRWLNMRDTKGQRRLENLIDPVRLEIEIALREKLKIIPTLLQGAKMPPEDKLPEALAPLPGIQALAITDDWDAGVAKLIGTLDRVVEKKEATEKTQLEHEALVAGEARLEQERKAQPIEPIAIARPSLTPPSAPTPQKRRGVLRALVTTIVVLGLVGGGVLLVTLNHHRAQSSDGTSTTQAGAALHDYLWNAYDLVTTSSQQRSGVKTAIKSGNGDALRGFQESRRRLLAAVEQWRVPEVAKQANFALEQALQYSAISDGNWANYTNGVMTYEEARAYDNEKTHPAKFAFDRLYNQLRAGVSEPPPPLASDFLF